MKQIDPPTCDDRPLWDLFTSVYHFPSVALADELGLFSSLNQRPSTAEELAQNLSLGPRAAEALLGLMTSLGFLAQRAGRFYLTDLSRNYLVPESPYYWGPLIRFFREAPINWSSLREALEKDKQPGLVGDDIWETHEIDPERAKGFTDAMHAHIFAEAMGTALRGDFNGVNRMLDVAGGSGCFCIALALRYPEMRFTVADLPVVCPVTEGYIAQYGLQERIDTLGLNMFKDPWPQGYDAHFFSNIFHDWGRARCEVLAAKSFEALPPGGQIYLHEMLLDDTKVGHRTATAFSMNMLFFTEGKQYTTGELDSILRGAGFEEVSVTPTYGYYSLVRGRKT
jgi:hypothetical protein